METRLALITQPCTQSTFSQYCPALTQKYGWRIASGVIQLQLADRYVNINIYLSALRHYNSISSASQEQPINYSTR